MVMPSLAMEFPETGLSSLACLEILMSAVFSICSIFVWMSAFYDDDDDVAPHVAESRVCVVIHIAFMAVAACGFSTFTTAAIKELLLVASSGNIRSLLVGVVPCVLVVPPVLMMGGILVATVDQYRGFLRRGCRCDVLCCLSVGFILGLTSGSVSGYFLGALLQPLLHPFLLQSR